MSPDARGHRRCVRAGRLALAAALTGAWVVASTSVPAGAGPLPGGTAVLVATSTTVPASTSSTVPDTTTSTVPSTTTTTVPATTTSTSSTTTTTHPSTTTTTLPITTVPTSSTPWGLIALVVVLVLAILGVILLYRSRTKKAALDAWRRRALPALSDARLARDALLSPSATSDDAELRGAVAVQAERAAVALDHAGSTSPDPAAGGSATTAAGALRGLAFAVEADRLLRHGAAAPTGVQLADADAARRDRDGELQRALARLQSHVAPPHKG